MTFPPPPEQQQQPGAFSLTELLIIMALVAILATLLAPMVGKSTATAQQAACVSNLRQLHHAAILWMNERDGAMPRAEMWMHDFAPYLEMPAASGWKAGTRSPYRCPASQAKLPSTQAYDWTYSLNEYASADQTAYPAYQIPRLPAVYHPSELSLLMDGATSKSGGGTYWRKVNKANVPPSYSSAFVYPHTGAMNVLFLDGHIRLITSGEMEKDFNTHASRFWRNLP